MVRPLLPALEIAPAVDNGRRRFGGNLRGALATAITRPHISRALSEESRDARITLLAHIDAGRRGFDGSGGAQFFRRTGPEISGRAGTRRPAARYGAVDRAV
jgi:hypothetical protein